MGKKKLTTPETITEEVKTQPVKEVVAETTDVEKEKPTEKTAEKKPEKKEPKQSRSRGKKYVESRSRVDKTKLYTLTEAVKLINVSSA